ncbi:MAG: adenylate kinase [Oscillospiraceae bacterium]
MKLILLGAPGAGKGTQGSMISKKYGIPVVSTGDMLRTAIREGTELGRRAKEIIDRGDLVSDDVIMSMLAERLKKPDCEPGYILDGVPRTTNQAEALEDIDTIDLVIEIDVPDSSIVKRLVNRRICPKCGLSFNLISMPPKKDGICDRCGTALIKREDDNPDTIAERLRVYHESTEPLKNFYRKTGRLVVIPGERSIEEVSKDVFKALEGESD